MLLPVDFVDLTLPLPTVYYSGTILKQAGITNVTLAIWLSAVIAACNFIFTLVGLALVERAGMHRATLLHSSFAFTSILYIRTQTASAVEFSWSDSVSRHAGHQLLLRRQAQHCAGRQRPHLRL